METLLCVGEDAVLYADKVLGLVAVALGLCAGEAEIAENVGSVASLAAYP